MEIPPVHDSQVEPGKLQVDVRFRYNPRARRYILRFKQNRTFWVTVPRMGNKEEAIKFVERQKSWILQQLHRQAQTPAPDHSWRIGTKVWFRGELIPISAAPEDTMVMLGQEPIIVTTTDGNLRFDVEGHLLFRALQEIPPRVKELAIQHAFSYQKIQIRNQRTRWGSCSRRGTISLNFRLIQTPDFVRDYIILHELTHLRHMNHSAHFWKEVERVCPGYIQAEKWLKQHRLLSL